MYQNYPLQGLQFIFELHSKKLLALFFLLSSFSILSANVYQYQIKDLSTLASCSDSSFIDLNDKGQVVLHCKLSSDDFYSRLFGVWDPNKGLKFLPTKKWEKIKEIKKLNNNGWMIGEGEKIVCVKSDDNNLEYYVDLNEDNTSLPARSIDCAIIWNSSTEEVIFLNDEDLKLVDINEQNQILAFNEDKNECFILDDQERYYLDLKKEINKIGYHPMRILPQKLNNKGEILGQFEYGVKHPYREEWRKEGVKFFFWDGQIHIIDDLTREEHYRYNIYINDLSEIFFLDSYRNKDSFKWDRINGIQLIKNYPFNIPELISISDNMQNAIEKNRQILNIWTRGKKGGYFDEHDFANFLFDRSLYPEVNFKSLVKINNKGQIIIKGDIWNETHYFLLDPIQ